MRNPNWEYVYKYKTYEDIEEKKLKGIYYLDAYSTYKFKNKRKNNPITKIIIMNGIQKNDHKSVMYFEEIQINFSNYLEIIKLYEDIKKKYDHLYLIYINKQQKYISFFRESDFLLCNNNVIIYLEKLDEVKPLKIFKKIEYVEKILKHNDNIYNYPKILKNIKNLNINKINLEQISQIDKEYHDKLINSLTLKEKFTILKKYEKSQFEYNYNLLKNEVKDNLDVNKINKLIKMIEYLSKFNDEYDKIYNTTNIYSQYLNYLSIKDIINKLNTENISNNKAFEIINYLYNQNELTLSENIKLVKIIDNKYKDKDLSLIKNKILCKLITNNTNLDNEVFMELMKYDDLIEGFINLSIKNNKLINELIL